MIDDLMVLFVISLIIGDVVLLVRIIDTLFGGEECQK